MISLIFSLKDLQKFEELSTSKFFSLSHTVALFLFLSLLSVHYGKKRPYIDVKSAFLKSKLDKKDICYTAWEVCEAWVQESHVPALQCSVRTETVVATTAQAIAFASKVLRLYISTGQM